MEDLKQAAALVEAAEQNAGCVAPSLSQAVPSKSTAAVVTESARPSESPALVYSLPLIAGSHDASGVVLDLPEKIPGEEKSEDVNPSENSEPKAPPEEEKSAGPPPPLDGSYEMVDEDGRRSLLTYKDGELTGPVFLFEADGTLIFEGELDHGKLCGLCKSYENGILRSEVIMKQGVLHGPAKQFDETGELSNEVTFVSGIKQGEMLQYDTQGNVSTQACFVDNVLEGPFKTFTQGDLTLQTTYKEGKIQGLSENFYSQVEGGRPLRIATYKQGNLHGEEKIYHSSGKLLVKTEYANGKAVGKATIYPTQPEK